MPTTDTLTTNTAEMISATSPMDFFSMVHQIESCICAKTVEILSNRGWAGPLTQQDWQCAEELVLDPISVSTVERADGLLYRIPVAGYRTEEIRLHMEGDLLCLCGCMQRQPRMFYTRIKLPAFARDCRFAAWISGEVLQVTLTREQAPSLQDLVSAPRPVQSVATEYAAAV